MAKTKIIGFLFPLFVSFSLMAAQNEPLIMNSTNIAALSSLACGLFANKSLTIHYHDQFLFHEFEIEKKTPESTLVTGVCSTHVDSSSQKIAGERLEFEIDENRFNTQDDPSLTAFIGDWALRFYFKTQTLFDGQHLRHVKSLDQVALFNTGTQAQKTFLKYTGFLDFALAASEMKSPVHFSFSGSWHNPRTNSLINIEGLGPRSIESLRLWATPASLLLNTTGLVAYWGQGEGHPSGNEGDAVFFPKSGASLDGTSWIGCSYFVESTHHRMTASTCRQQWSILESNSGNR